MTESESALPLAVVFKGWDGYNRNLIQLIAPLSQEQLDQPISSKHWSLGMAIQHIVTDRAWWFHDWVGEGGDGMIAYTNWDGEGKPIRSADELVTALEATWATVEGALNRWTVADLGHVFEQPPTLTEQERSIFSPITLQELVWHVMTHDYHHGGELAAGMGVYDLPTVSGWGS